MNEFVNHLSTTQDQGIDHGKGVATRRTLESDKSIVTFAAAPTQGWKTACRESRSLNGYSLRVEDGNSLGVFAQGNGVWIRNDMLATASRLAGCRDLAEGLATLARRARTFRCDRLEYISDRQLQRPRSFWGAKTGPNPTDRAKAGSKRHLITDGRGTPLAIEHTGANVHDSEMAIPLVDSIPTIKTKSGGRRRRPDELLGDRAYDAEEKVRRQLRKRNIDPLIAKRGTENGSGLGKYRYVVEACFEWLFTWRRLRVRYEKRDDIHQAFLIIGCVMICWNRVTQFC